MTIATRRRGPWWLRYAVTLALTDTGFVLRDHGLRDWQALANSVAFVVLFDPAIKRAMRWARRRGRA